MSLITRSNRPRATAGIGCDCGCNACHQTGIGSIPGIPAAPLVATPLVATPLVAAPAFADEFANVYGVITQINTAFTPEVPAEPVSEPMTAGVLDDVNETLNNVKETTSTALKFGVFGLIAYLILRYPMATKKKSKIVDYALIAGLLWLLTRSIGGKKGKGGSTAGGGSTGDPGTGGPVVIPPDTPVNLIMAFAGGFVAFQINQWNPQGPSIPISTQFVMPLRQDVSPANDQEAEKAKNWMVKRLKSTLKTLNVNAVLVRVYIDADLSTDDLYAELANVIADESATTSLIFEKIIDGSGWQTATNVETLSPSILG